MAVTVENGILIARRNVRNNKEAAQHWGRCVENKAPYVRIFPRQTLATVYLDMEPTGRDLGRAECAMVAALLPFFLQRPTYGLTNLGPEIVRFANVRLEDARELAVILLEIANSGGRDLGPLWQRIRGLADARALIVTSPVILAKSGGFDLLAEAERIAGRRWQATERR